MTDLQAPTAITLGGVLAEAARRFGDRPAYTMADDPGRTLTYRELDRLASEVAAGLAARGVSAGDVVALHLPPCLEYLAAYLAAARIGAVTAGINHHLTPTEQAALVRVVDPVLVVADADGDAADGGRPTVAVRTRTGPPLAGLRVEPGGLPEAPADPDHPVAICFTSGSTGRPKAAVFGNRQLATITGIDTGGRWGGGRVAVAGTSLAHLGPMTKLPGSLMRGGTTHIMRRWHPGAMLDLVERLGVTAIGGISTQVAMLLAHDSFPTRDLSSVQLIVMGGGPATPALVRRARAGFEAPVTVRYSCTEAGIGVGTGPEDPPEDAEVSVGRPHPGVELAIRDGDRDLPPGEVGEVLLRSGAVFSGYHGDPDATAAAFTDDGFVRTGDLGYVDEAGRLRLAGRRSERYVRGGYNVEPQEVEAVLADHPDVREIVVVPRPDDVWGEIGVAVVVADHGAELDLAGLRGFGRSALASYKLPEAVVQLERLPLTAGQKIDRRALTQLVRG